MTLGPSLEEAPLAETELDEEAPLRQALQLAIAPKRVPPS